VGVPTRSRSPPILLFSAPFNILLFQKTTTTCKGTNHQDYYNLQHVTHYTPYNTQQQKCTRQLSGHQKSTRSRVRIPGAFSSFAFTVDFLILLPPLSQLKRSEEIKKARNMMNNFERNNNKIFLFDF